MPDYSDIQQELDAFQNATYGEDVRGSMISVTKKIHDIAEQAGGGESVPITVRQAIYTILSNVAVDDNNTYTSEIAVLQSWATGYTITWSGSHYTKGNNTAAVASGDSFTSTITADGGYDITNVTVTMGGVTVAGAYSSGTVTIPSVTGNVVITVTTSALSVSSISAVYTQGGTVYAGDSLDSLKADLVVTATYSDSSTAVISASDYTLSGTLTEGTSTITVTYSGCTDTFTVTVSASMIMSATQGNITSGSTDADKVTIVFNTLSFEPSEVKTISVDDGYQFFAFTNYGVSDIANAGTAYSNNQMNAYAIGSNGYVQSRDEINNRIVISSTSNWQSSKTYTNSSSAYSMEITGMAIYIKTTDGTALSTDQARTVFHIS